MTDYSHTKSRVLQWLGIIVFLSAMGGAYWYFQVRASTVNAPQNDSLTNGLVGLWSFNGDDISGTTAYDRSGSGNNGTLTNGPTKGAGKVGQALSFDGTDDEVTTTTNQGSASTLKVLTLSAWFKTSSASGKKMIGMENVQTGTGAATSDRQLWVGIDGKVRFGIFTSTIKEVTSQTALNDNRWHHAVGVSTGDSGTMYLYIDGVLQGTTSIGATIYTYGAASYWRIGGYRNNGWSSGVNGYFTGQIDETRVYNRALTATEIQSLYALGQSDKVNSAVSQPQGTGRLDSGLAGYWKLDDGSGTSATDSSTNGNTGTLTNGPTWTTGQIGSGVVLDGSNDSIKANGLAGASSPIGSGDVTFSARIKLSAVHNTSSTPDKFIMSLQDIPSTNDVWLLFLSGNDVNGGVDGALCFEFYDAARWYACTSQTSWSAGTWQHVVGTYSSVTGSKLYLDGKLVGSNSHVGRGTTKATEFTIGNVCTTCGSAPFPGTIDEARVYNRALSAEEVADLYRLNTPTGTDTSLKGYWSFNGQDINGTTAADRSGAGNTGTLTNTPTKVPGKLGQAIDFDGTDDYITVPDNATLDVTDTADLTLSGWFNRDTFTTDDTIIAKRNGIANTDDGYILYIDDATDQLIFETSEISGTDEYSLTSTSTFTTAGWNHFTVVWDQDSAANSEIYINGVANQATDTGTIANIGDLSNTLAFQTGAESDAGNPFDGKLDEIRLYNRALSVTEIQSLYALGQSDKTNSSVSQPQGTGRLDSGLAGYWKFDNGSGATASDSSVNTKDGTLSGAGLPSWTTGQINGALDFNGSSSYVAADGFAGASSPIATGDVSYSVWIKLSAIHNSGSAAKIIAALSDATSTNDVVLFFNTNASFGTDGALCMFVYDAASYSSCTTQTSWSAGTWQHVVGTYSSVTGSKLYLDGIQVGSNSHAGRGTTKAAKFTFGANYPGGTGSFFPGTIDEARVYNRALSADEVAELYRLTTPSGTDTSLKGYWSFNGQDISGTTAFDRSGGGRNGTLTNGPTVTPGKLGQGLNFDGTNDYVQVANHQSLDFTTDYTLSAWIYPTLRTSYNPIIVRGTGDTDDIEVYTADSTGSQHLTIGHNRGNGGTFEYVADSAMSGVSGNGGWNQPAANTWTLLTITYANSDTLKVYYNGVQVGNTITGMTPPIDTNRVWRFGRVEHSGFAAFNQYFDGKIDEVRVYNRALTADEIKALYNSSR